MTATPLPAPAAEPPAAQPAPAEASDAQPAPAPAAQPTEPPAEQPALAPVEAPWRRLSSRMLAVQPVLELARSLPALIAVLFAGSSTGHGGLWGLVGAGVAIGLGVLRWATTSYRITGAQIQVRRGFLRRRVLSVPRDRVRTVDTTSHALHRMFGLARVTIGTGQSDRRKEALKLDGLTGVEAARLRTELLHRGTPARPRLVPTARTAPDNDPAGIPRAAELATVPDSADLATDPTAETVLAQVRPSWVRYGPFTLSGVVTVGVVGGFLWRLANEAHLSPRRIGPLHAAGQQLARVPLPVAVLEVLLVALLVVALASAGGYVLAFWSFRLTRQHAGTLHVQRGLITTRAITIEERRLRGVELSEPLLLRAVGGARCIAIATGLRVGRGSERGGSLLLPPAPRAEAVRVAGAVLGDPAPIEAALSGHGLGALRRRVVRGLVGGALIPAAAALLWWLGAWPAWPALVTLPLIPLGALLAVDRYRNLGHTIAAGYLVVRQGSLVRRRAMLSCDGIIGWHLRQSFFQRRAGLVTVIATTAAGRQRYALPDLPVHRSVPLVDRAMPDLLRPFLAPGSVPPG